MKKSKPQEKARPVKKHLVTRVHSPELKAVEGLTPVEQLSVNLIKLHYCAASGLVNCKPGEAVEIRAQAGPAHGAFYREYLKDLGGLGEIEENGAKIVGKGKNAKGIFVFRLRKGKWTAGQEEGVARQLEKIEIALQKLKG